MNLSGENVRNEMSEWTFVVSWQQEVNKNTLFSTNLLKGHWACTNCISSKFIIIEIKLDFDESRIKHENYV